MSEKQKLLDWVDNIEFGIILEQNWMLEEVIKNFPGGQDFYCFSIDRNVYVMKEDNKKFAFVQSNGSASTACYVEELLKRHVKRVYRVGTCGSLQDNINIGDAVLSIAAIRDEGTSTQYIPSYFPAVSEPQRLIDLYNFLLKEGIPIHKGITWTTDGRFVESNEKISQFSKLDIKNVDMETSTVLVVCSIHKIPGISIGVVTDKPIKDINKEFKGTMEDLKQIKSISEERIIRIIQTIINFELQ